MPNEVLHKNGTPTVWADTTDYSSTITGLARTHQIDLTSLASGGDREGAKADLGATRARQYSVFVGIEFDVAPTAGQTVDFYFAFSPSATAGNANPGQASGTDQAFAGDDTERAQLLYAGSLVTTADAATTVQYQYVGMITALDRYVSPVVENSTSQALEGDAVEMLIALIPIIDEVQ